MRNFSIILCALLLAGCSLAPKYEPVEFEMPSSGEKTEIDREWWKGFGDEKLNAVVEEALRQNHDLLTAAANVEQSRAALGIASSQLYPNISASGAGKRSWIKNPADDGKFIHNDQYALSGVLSYELDLFSKLRDGKRSALSQLLAMEAAKEGVRLAIIAGAVESYYSLIAAEMNRQSVADMLENKNESFKLREAQARAGALDELTLSQISANMSATRAELINTERNRDAARNAIALLLGRSPKAIVEGEVALSGVFPAQSLAAANLPSDLLLRRPDIIAAEERLKAANYSIGAARALYLPSISLTGTAGVASAEFGDLLKSASQTASAGVDINLPIFSFGRISSQIDSAEAAKELAIISYKKSVSQAFSEVNDALSRRDQAARRLNEIVAQEASLERALELTKRKYDAGYIGYIDVIDAETDLLNAQMALNGASLENVSAQVELFKALGGGYAKEERE